MLLEAEIKSKENKYAEEKKELGIVPSSQVVLTDDILNRIKEKVGMHAKKPVVKMHIQPGELDKIMPEVLQQLEMIGAGLQKMVPISYGRQLTIVAGLYWAEINLFYGQKGVRIVVTTKTGSNAQLCESIVTLLKGHFQQY